MVAKRLGEYFLSKGIPLSNAEKKLSLGNNTLSKAIKENKSIGSSTIEKIISVFSDLNIDWLFTGRGNMFLENKDSYYVVNDINKYVGKTEEMLKLLEAKLKEKEEMIDLQRHRIRSLEEKEQNQTKVSEARLAVDA